MRRIFPPVIYNPVTLIGAAISAASFGLILFLFLLEAIATQPQPYMGIVAFVIMPAFLLIGLALVVVGIIREYIHTRGGSSPRELKVLRIDLNNARHRTAIVFFSVGAVLLLMASALGSFKAYEYTGSNEFCGLVCHQVMAPEYTTYQSSPHARVTCVKCHIGSGADWFVRSKLSGSYQFYATLFNKYPRPIPTPIENLRPAQETCEQCHWPKHFYSDKERTFNYFMGDEKNTPWKLDLLMRIGGGNIETGPTSGIHWHMNIANKVTYVTLDSLRMNIPWIRSEGLDGKATIYRNKEISVTEEMLQEGHERRMDCVDCHNRPSHEYHPPPTSVNYAMSQGWIDPNLPYVKDLALNALKPEYKTKEAAMKGIKARMEQFYGTRYPRVADSLSTEISRAIKQVQKIYDRNFYPEMQITWQKYPDQIGHLYARGCFRCHDDKHVSDDGKVLSKDCNTCHILLAQELDGDQRLSLSGVEYYHPEDVGTAWMEMNCDDCHNKRQL